MPAIGNETLIPLKTEPFVIFKSFAVPGIDIRPQQNRPWTVVHHHPEAHDVYLRDSIPFSQQPAGKQAALGRTLETRRAKQEKPSTAQGRLQAARTELASIIAQRATQNP